MLTFKWVASRGWQAAQDFASCFPVEKKSGHRTLAWCRTQKALQCYLNVRSIWAATNCVPTKIYIYFCFDKYSKLKTWLTDDQNDLHNRKSYWRLQYVCLVDIPCLIFIVIFMLLSALTPFCLMHIGVCYNLCTISMSGRLKLLQFYFFSKGKLQVATVGHPAQSQWHHGHSHFSITIKSHGRCPEAIFIPMLATSQLNDTEAVLGFKWTLHRTSFAGV